jgi:hypothetical protein
MGRDPGRCSFIVNFIPASASGDFCSSSQSFVAMVLLQIWASQGGFFFEAAIGDEWTAAVDDDGSFWRRRESLGPGTFLQFVFLLRAYV